MRHGRKSRSKLFDGYKRHVLTDLDLGVIRAVGITAANEAEAVVVGTLDSDLESQNQEMIELHIDRAYLSSRWVHEPSEKFKIFCKAWPVRNGKCFDKTAFVLDWKKLSIKCPNQVTLPFFPGKVVKFTAQAVCPLRARCTTSKKGRSVSIHPDEALFQELLPRQLTSSGRAKLRERTAVEHSLAHVGYWQGNQARYIVKRKNLFDLRRVAVVHNLHVIARIPELDENQQQNAPIAR